MFHFFSAFSSTKSTTLNRCCVPIRYGFTSDAISRETFFLSFSDKYHDTAAVGVSSSSTFCRFGFCREATWLQCQLNRAKSNKVFQLKNLLCDIEEYLGQPSGAGASRTNQLENWKEAIIVLVEHVDVDTVASKLSLPKPKLLSVFFSFSKHNFNCIWRLKLVIFTIYFYAVPSIWKNCIGKAETCGERRKSENEFNLKSQLSQETLHPLLFTAKMNFEITEAFSHFFFFGKKKTKSCWGIDTPYAYPIPNHRQHSLCLRRSRFNFQNRKWAANGIESMLFRQ